MKILSLASALLLPAALRLGLASARAPPRYSVTPRSTPPLIGSALPPSVAGFSERRRGVEVLPVPLLRGGSDATAIDAEAEVPSAALEAASDALLYAFAALSALHGVAFALLPAFSTKFYGEDVEPGSIEEYCQEAAGCFVLELGVTGFLAASDAVGGVGIDRAIAYGTIPDLYFMAKNLATGKFAEFGTGVRNFMAGATVVTAACAYSLFTEKWHPETVAKVITVLPAVKGIYSYVDPVGSGKRMLGTDIGENDKAQSLYCTAGQAKVVSAFYRGSLAFGVRPLRGLGYSMLLQSAMLIERLMIRRGKDTDHSRTSNLYHLALSLVMGGVWVFAS